MAAIPSSSPKICRNRRVRSACDGNHNRERIILSSSDLQCTHAPYILNDIKSGNKHGCDVIMRLTTSRDTTLLFQIRTQQPYLQTLYCITTSNGEGNGRTDVVGSCLLSFDNRLQSSFYPLSCNISELNAYMCAGLNREGQLCGRCVQGFAPPVFSYSLACVNCTHYHLNWLKYIGVAFGPLTVFCLLICFFHISATSPYLFGFVLYCQILSMPTIVRMGENTNGFKEAKEGTRFGERFYVSLLSIWNLDILRAFYEPFCLHPHMSIVQALALDYLVALYATTKMGPTTQETTVSFQVSFSSHDSS